MPAVKLTASKYYTLFISSITLDGKIMSPCSYYMKKGLVCIIIVNPSSRQPFSYSKCIKLNTRALCNMRSVSLNKYTFFTCLNSL